MLIALSTGSTDDALIMAIVALLANGVLQQMIQPFVMGATLSLNPLVVLVVTIGAGALFGMVGLTLAAPLTSAAVHIVNELRARSDGAGGDEPSRRRPGRTLGRTPSAALPCHRAARDPRSRASRAAWRRSPPASGHSCGPSKRVTRPAWKEAVLRLSRSRRVFAPLAFAIGAFALLFGGLRLLVSNWRLTLVQLLPAMGIWLAMADLKAHALRG